MRASCNAAAQPPAARRGAHHNGQASRPSLPGAHHQQHALSVAGTPRIDRLRARAAAAAASADDLTLCEKGERLKAWVQSQGGYVNPNLVVRNVARCGTRGVTAAAPIGLDVIAAEPLVLVPERLYMTTLVAKERFSSTPGAPIADLDPVMQLALLLAVERQAGAASFWHAYIDALPARPPSAWCMTPAEVRQTSGALQALLPDLDIPQEVLKVQRQIQSECEVVALTQGQRLGVSASDLFWAKGQVLSRCFGGGEELGLAPFIDLINHGDRAGKPDAVEVHDEVVVFVSSSLGSVGVPLAQGDELYIDYISNTKPFTAYLSFGFVPALVMGQAPDDS